jgi:signal transduction histidine kinase
LLQALLGPEGYVTRTAASGKKALAVANEAIRGFTAAAAHDLRTPLTTIIGFSILLTRYWETFSEESRRKFVASIDRQSHNYLQNTFKYGRPPARIEAAQVGDMVEVRVLDGGPGVPPEFVESLFDRFARADTPATRAHEGTGLGLSIVRGLAEVNSGQARYEPNLPSGSCFVVGLPAGDPAFG